MSKEKRTGLILKISLIILALLGSFLIMVTFVLLYWQNLKLSNEQESLKEEIAKLEREISKLKKTEKKELKGDKKSTGGEGGADPYEGWQTYASEKYGFSIKYPPGWTYEEAGSSLHVTFFGPKTKGDSVITHEALVYIYVEEVAEGMSLDQYVNQSLNEPQGKGEISEQGPTTLDENEAYQVIDTFYEVGHYFKRKRVWSIFNGEAYTVGYEAETSKYDTYFHLFDLMLDSFHVW